MFGYVEPDKPELKIREYDVFRGYYCSLCKTLGRRYGQVSRLTLNYDLAFLYVLLDSMSSLPIGGKRQRCIAHPLKKRFIIFSNKFAEYTSDMNIILMYYNLEDKWNDEKNVMGGTGALALKRAFKKAKKRHPEKCAAIENHLKTLSNLERQGCDSVDEVAEEFAAIMREIFECGIIEDENDMKALGWMGYNLGRWIYILDAYDDIEKDVKHNSFNPLVTQYGFKGDNANDFKESIWEKVNFTLTFSLSELEKAYSLLAIEKNNAILDNILYSGLIVKTDKVLQERGIENGKESL
ncbi:MAG: hypothetical protein GX625_04575 [Clostridiaceae bacterium]|nr:hypothetical protein [Clostridiaceae bacterium]